MLFRSRQLATHLATPVWIIDDQGELVFFNEPAEVALGIAFSEIGSLVAVDLAAMFDVTEVSGEPLAEDDLPVITTLRTQQPSSRRLRFQAKDGVWRVVDVMAMPINVHGDRFLGVFSAFWEVET